MMTSTDLDPTATGRPSAAHRQCAAGCGRSGTVRVSSRDVAGAPRWRAEEVRHVCTDCAARMRGEEPAGPVRLEDLPPVPVERQHHVRRAGPGWTCDRCGKGGKHEGCGLCRPCYKAVNHAARKAPPKGRRTVVIDCDWAVSLLRSGLGIGGAALTMGLEKSTLRRRLVAEGRWPLPEVKR